MENMLQASSEELSFALWYLKQRGHVVSDDKSNLQLTADGMDYLERHPPTAEAILPLIKPESVAVAKTEPPPPPPPPERKPESSALKALQRVLSRDHLPQNVRTVAPQSKS
jgi:hypothetical protein